MVPFHVTGHIYIQTYELGLQSASCFTQLSNACWEVIRKLTVHVQFNLYSKTTQGK